ncbi:MAG: DUF2281 domain-containing protein [Bacteroidetes bacterium]|nr:DUF2281 domain-containing protein [Bacteroidota bacterium]MBL7103151.1 DUF2281 domain-containing protein [Bacteroidales bacterium]
MPTLSVEINSEIKSLNPVYLKEVYDFIQFLKEKQRKESDTEYLSNIPGMVESIIEEDNKPLSDYSKELDW